MKHLFTIIFLSISITTANAQLGGMRAYTGITIMTNQDVAVNPEGYSYSGYHAGADGRLMSGTMSFLLGVRYTVISRSPQEGIKLFDHDSKISLMNGRVGLDYSIFSLKDIFRVRVKALGSFDIVIVSSGDPIDVPGYKLNDGWLGGVAGLGFDIGPIVLDLEYEVGILNAYFQKKTSKFNTLSLSAGFFF